MPPDLRLRTLVDCRTDAGSALQARGRCRLGSRSCRLQAVTGRTTPTNIDQRYGRLPRLKGETRPMSRTGPQLYL
jgi:hypothetical protein